MCRAFAAAAAGEGHILAFLTGQDEIEKACGMIKKAVEEDRVKGVPHQVMKGERGGEREKDLDRVYACKWSCASRQQPPLFSD
jgi:HrpA-like RNA helicase